MEMMAGCVYRGSPLLERRRASGPVRHQEAFVREAVLLFIIVSIFGVVVLDVLAVYTTHRNLKDETRKAADAAAAAYVATANDQSAEQAAAEYLSGRRARLVSFQGDRVNGQITYTVTAQRSAKTYLFKYFTHLPKIGSWFDRQLHPEVTGDNL